MRCFMHAVVSTVGLPATHECSNTEIAGVSMWLFFGCVLAALLAGCGTGFIVAAWYAEIAEQVYCAISRRDASVRPHPPREPSSALRCNPEPRVTYEMFSTPALR